MKKQSTSLLAAILLVAGTAAGCATSEASAETAAAPTESTTTTIEVAETQAAQTGLGAVGTLDSDTVHTIDVSFDDDAYSELIETYRSTGEKDWIEATVTIDGTTYEGAGIRLKGNSSLFSLTDSSDPESLPWLIKLDKYVDGQSHEGLTDLVVRSNNTTTALNEAVALELLELAGLASQDSIAASFSVNGSDAVLRLVMEHPDDIWMSEVLDTSGALFKAESTGDYSYRGDDPDSYDEVFDQEAGKDNADLTPLIEFLEFINDSDDAMFNAELDDWLDVDAFATYLAMQDLIDNFDDIDGPGNNSYLYYDTETGQFTVVPWDHNLAFGVTNGGGRPGDLAGGAQGLAPGAGDDGLASGPGERGVRPGGQAGPVGQGREQSNVLVERFLANDTWSDLVQQRTAELTAALYDSGVAADVLEQWTDVVAASGLVDTATINAEASQIGRYFNS